jgi:DNA processing protein
VGLQAAADIARGLAEAGWTVVSGLAVGIDAAAHEAALEAGGTTVAVLGCGLDVPYPTKNIELKRRIAERGTIVTEHPKGTPPCPHHFPERNRIIAGLSWGIVVVEGSIRSGAMVTARLGLEMNRSIYAVPGSLRNPMAAGPNALIRTSQAMLVTEVTHLFEDLAPSLSMAAVTPTTSAQHRCTDEELGVLRALDDAPLPLDRVVGTSGLPAGRAAVTLAQLEVRSLVVRTGGGYVVTEAGGRVMRND